MTDTEVINSVKDAIYKSLSYTNQDYETILADIINIFTGDSTNNGAISTKWNNISESDIMFIFMSILAAHKDILNYMLDYRTQEGYMSTAKEDQSIRRIAASFGYKIPHYKAGRAILELTSFTGSPEDLTLAQYTVMTDDNGNTWSYIGETLTDFNLDSEIELFQGSLVNINIDKSIFTTNSSRTCLLTDQSVAIGNNYNANGVSTLVNGDTEFTEVDNLYAYNGDTDYVYELNVDPQGLAYIKLPTYLDLESLGDTFTLYYTLTSGSLVSSVSTITVSLPTTADPGTTQEVELTLVSGSFYVGSNPYTSSQTREAFKNYYASVSTLVSVNDFKNFILNVQKVVPNIEKCLVIDTQTDTLGGSGDLNITAFDIAIYTLKTDNTLLTTGVGEEEILIDELNKYKISGVNLYLNKNNYNTDQDIAAQDIYVELDGTSAGTTITDTIKTLVSEYVEAKSFGETITVEEIYAMLKENGYTTFYGHILIGTSPSPTVETPIILNYYNYSSCPIGNVTAI